MTPPEGWLAYTAEQLGMPGYKIPIIILSTAIMYLAFMLTVRVVGRRVLSASNFAGAIAAIMLGSLAARAILGSTPTVAAGITAIATLVAIESAFHGLARSHKRLAVRPTLVFADGNPIKHALRKTHTSESDLHSAMRAAGVQSPSQVRFIVLEPRGTLSVIRAGSEGEAQAAAPLLESVDGYDTAAERSGG